MSFFSPVFHHVLIILPISVLRLVQLGTHRMISDRSFKLARAQDVHSHPWRGAASLREHQPINTQLEPLSHGSGASERGILSLGFFFRSRMSDIPAGSSVG